MYGFIGACLILILLLPVSSGWATSLTLESQLVSMHLGHPHEEENTSTLRSSSSPLSPQTNTDNHPLVSIQTTSGNGTPAARDTTTQLLAFIVRLSSQVNSEHQSSTPSTMEEQRLALRSIVDVFLVQGRPLFHISDEHQRSVLMNAESQAFSLFNSGDHTDHTFVGSFPVSTGDLSFLFVTEGSMATSLSEVPEPTTLLLFLGGIGGLLGWRNMAQKSDILR